MTALLVVDLETTDLDPAKLTILEAAWCITDMAGQQRLPLRSRYTEITVAGHGAVTPDRYVGGAYRWHNGEHGNSYALKMAEQSRLFTDWLACPRDQVLQQPRELERLILDDIHQACDMGELNPEWRPGVAQSTIPSSAIPRWSREPERIYLAGMGVAQFDQPILRLVCPKVVAHFGRSGATHYRPGGDVSIAQTALLGGAEEHALIQWGLEEYGYPGIAGFTLGYPPQCAAGPGDWLVEKPHRAVLDVMRAIAVQRVLWRVGEPLRKALGLEKEE